MELRDQAKRKSEYDEYDDQSIELNYGWIERRMNNQLTGGTLFAILSERIRWTKCAFVD